MEDLSTCTLRNEREEKAQCLSLQPPVYQDKRMNISCYVAFAQKKPKLTIAAPKIEKLFWSKMRKWEKYSLSHVIRK